MRRINKLVEEILRKDERARDSDAYLLIKVYAVLFEAKGIHFDLEPVISFMKLISENHMPPVWSITRMRRKAQQDFPELRADKDIEAARELIEEDMRKWAVNPYQE